MIPVSFIVNGDTHNVEAPPMKRLLDVLREDLRLTGTKEGCGEGECGACAVIMDGLLVLSCMVPVCQVAGKPVTTIEGLRPNATNLDPLQTSFHKNAGTQCGICTPGMIMAAAYYRDHLDEVEDVREALAGNICRCTGYTRVFESIKVATR